MAQREKSTIIVGYNVILFTPVFYCAPPNPPRQLIPVCLNNIPCPPFRKGGFLWHHSSAQFYRAYRHETLSGNGFRQPQCRSIYRFLQWTCKTKRISMTFLDALS